MSSNKMEQDAEDKTDGHARLPNKAKVSMINWKDFMSASGSKSPHVPPVKLKSNSDIMKRRVKSACLMCIEKSCKNFNLTDNYESTVKRHIARNHSPNDGFNKTCILPLDHETIVEALKTYATVQIQSGEKMPDVKSGTKKRGVISESGKFPVKIQKKASVLPEREKYSTISIDMSDSELENCQSTIEKIDDSVLSETHGTQSSEFEINPPSPIEASSPISGLPCESHLHSIQKSISSFCKSNEDNVVEPEPDELLEEMDISNSKVIDTLLPYIKTLIDDVATIKKQTIEAKTDTSIKCTVSSDFSDDTKKYAAIINQASSMGDLISGGILSLEDAPVENFVKVSCSICRTYLIEKEPQNIKAHSSSSFAQGLTYSNDEWSELQLKKGNRQKWYKFKNRILMHHTELSKDGTHSKALTAMNKPSIQLKRSTKVIENIVRAAIRTVHSKGAALQFEKELGLLAACGADVGDIGHSRLASV